MEFSDFDITTLATEISTWLGTDECTPDSIQDYATSLREQGEELYLRLMVMLNSLLREEQIDGFEGIISLKVFQETDPLTIEQCIEVMADEDMETLKALFATIPGGDISQITHDEMVWAKEYLRAQRNYYLMRTSETIIRTSVYFSSLIHINIPVEKRQELASDIQAVLPDAMDLLLSADFEGSISTAEISTSIRSILEGFSIFPKEYIDSLLGGDFAAVVDLLVDLSKCLIVLDMYGETVKDQKQLKELLWREIASDEQIRDMGHIRARRTEIAEDPNREVLFKDLTKLISVGEIEKGKSQQYLRAYVNQLTPQQKKQFLELAEEFFSTYPVLKTLFDPIDPEYFIKTLKSRTLAGSKADFINSLQDKILPEYWPTVQKAMLMIASLY